MKVEKIGLTIRTRKAEYVFPTLRFSSRARKAIFLIALTDGITCQAPITDTEVIQLIAMFKHADAILRCIAAIEPAAIITGDRVELTGSGWDVAGETVRWARSFPWLGSTKLPYTR